MTKFFVDDDGDNPSRLALRVGLGGADPHRYTCEPFPPDGAVNALDLPVRVLGTLEASSGMAGGGTEGGGGGGGKFWMKRRASLDDLGLPTLEVRGLSVRERRRVGVCGGDDDGVDSEDGLPTLDCLRRGERSSALPPTRSRMST